MKQQRLKKKEYATLNTKLKIPSMENVNEILERSSVERLTNKLLENPVKEEQSEAEKKARKIIFKKIMALTVLNAATMSGVKIIGMSLSDIGLNSIVATNGIFAVGDFISNIIVFIISNKLPRKKTLIVLNLIIFSLGVCFVIISWATDYNETKAFNMVIAFFLKGTIMITLVFTMLFGSKWI